MNVQAETEERGGKICQAVCADKEHGCLPGPLPRLPAAILRISVLDLSALYPLTCIPAGIRTPSVEGTQPSGN